MDKQEKINFILGNFDFVKVQRVMGFLDWQWILPVPGGVPEVSDLVKAATKILNEAYDVAEKDFSNYRVGSGGLYATALVYNDDEIVLELSFILEYSEA